MRMPLILALIVTTSALAAAPSLEPYADWLARLRVQLPDRDRRLIAWAHARMGTPYVLDCQGEGAGQDADPLFTPGKLDCTVFTLQAAASADATDAADLLARMKRANYRRTDADGTVHFADRYHFSEDRVAASPLFEDLTTSLFPARDLVREHITLNRTPEGKPVMDIPWERPLDFVYRPTGPGERFTPEDIARFPPVCGVLFVKRSNRKFGTLVGHEGIVVYGRILIHASSKAKRVVMEPFVPYARTRDGIALYAFKQG